MNISGDHTKLTNIANKNLTNIILKKYNQERNNQEIRQGISMKGKVCFDKKSKKYYVAWYHAGTRKTIKLWYYNGNKKIPFRGKYGKELARRMLDQMRGDYENGVFRLEKYTQRASDVILYLRNWIEAVKNTITPATYKDYKNSIENHIVPFFESNNTQLHEIQYDTLLNLLNSINRNGKGKLNVMYCFHACLEYALRSNRISSMPPFPKKKMYQIIEPVIKWLPSERQGAIINAIPMEHQPIFWWLKYHLRRPGEAMALYKEDFDGRVFTVKRGFSNKKQINRTKTGEIHLIPAVSSFIPYIEIEEEKQRKCCIVSPYFFVNPKSKKPGKHYTLVFLESLWRKACEKVGESITLYQGTKHSTASQMINERNYSLSELQIAGDWARLESTKKYGKVEISTRRTLLEGKIVDLKKLDLKKLDLKKISNEKISNEKISLEKNIS
ncbi:MAG TPA: hypothetical protein DDW17_07985 [Deltaproteobacteria bacterium]|nr:hypothetical protein [Deltaproteobacteria bacterium]